MAKRPVHPLLLLAPAVGGIATSLVTALMLVPRVRVVEALTVFGTAVGGGAALVAAIVEFRKARAAAPRPAPPARIRP
jgi:hypothetical protein